MEFSFHGRRGKSLSVRYSLGVKMHLKLSKCRNVLEIFTNLLSLSTQRENKKKCKLKKAAVISKKAGVSRIFVSILENFPHKDAKSDP